jgi:hypothetical protein
MTWISSSLSAVTGSGPERRHRLAGVLVALLRLDAELRPMPSILGIARPWNASAGTDPVGSALLYALYHSDQWTVLQMSELENRHGNSPRA